MPKKLQDFLDKLFKPRKWQHFHLLILEQGQTSQVRPTLQTLGCPSGQFGTLASLGLQERSAKSPNKAAGAAYVSLSFKDDEPC